MPSSLEQLALHLRGLDPRTVALEPVADLIAATRVSPDELDARAFFREDRYVRVQLHRDELFEVLLICWGPGQVSRVHNHAGQLGWVRVLRGTLEETTYRPAARDAHALPDPEALDGGASLPFPLEQTGSARVSAGPAVVTVGPARGIHRLGNPLDVPAVSLHVYSRPHDRCLVYDLEAGTCRAMQLTHDALAGHGPLAG